MQVAIREARAVTSDHAYQVGDPATVDCHEGVEHRGDKYRAR